ncbi:MAG: MAPEG family protein [Deltaproteobacteria bacterium]|nr:MAPEG family protein [Deltaproteobacteria bacterium]
MSDSALALLAYCSWTLLLVATIGGMRAVLTLRGRRANSFDPSGTDVSAFSGRLCRAHANCYENFPVIGGLLIVALLTDNAAITDGLAFWMVAARLGQSLVHLASTRARWVVVRFHFFLAQVVIGGLWAVQLMMEAVG